MPMRGRKSSETAPRDEPPSADEEVAKLRLKLSRVPLAEVEEKGLVIWDRNQHIVRRGPNFDSVRSE